MQERTMTRPFKLFEGQKFSPKIKLLVDTKFFEHKR